MVFSALSVVSGIIVLVITLDHLGSRRVRGRVRRRAIGLFAEAKPIPVPVGSKSIEYNPVSLETVRLRLKRSRRLSPKGNWYPVEAKLFFVPFPLGGAYYADGTRAPFVSEKEVRWLEGRRAGQERRLLSVFRLSAKKKVSLPLAWWILHAPWYPDLLHHPGLKVELPGPRKYRLTWKEAENWSIDLVADDKGQWTESVLYGFRQKKEEPLLRCRWTDYKDFDSWSIPTGLITQQYDQDSWWTSGHTQVTDWVANEAFKWW